MKPSTSLWKSLKSIKQADPGLSAQQEPKIAPTNTQPQTQVQTAAQSKQSFYNPNDMG